MAEFVSKLYPGEIVITDRSTESEMMGYGGNRGMYQRDFRAVPRGSVGAVPAFGGPLIERGANNQNWIDIIEQKEKTNSRVSDVLLGAGLPSKDQGQTNFCWVNGPLGAVEATRVINGLPYIELSPASVACKINNFQNQGGWGIDACKYIAEHGPCEASDWPCNTISRKYDTAAANEKRGKHILTEWGDLEPKNEDVLMSCSLSDLPMAAGYNWFGHETYIVEPVYLGSGVFGFRSRNSWSDKYGYRGFYITVGKRRLPDDCQVLRSTTASVA
jgi:hypothetical protein